MRPQSLVDRFHQRAGGSEAGWNHRCLSNLPLPFGCPRALSSCLIAIVLGAQWSSDGRPGARRRCSDTTHNRTCRCMPAHSCGSVSWDSSLSRSLPSRALHVSSVRCFLRDNAPFPAGGPPASLFADNGTSRITLAHRLAHRCPQSRTPTSWRGGTRRNARAPGRPWPCLPRRRSCSHDREARHGCPARVNASKRPRVRTSIFRGNGEGTGKSTDSRKNEFGRAECQRFCRVNPW